MMEEIHSRSEKCIMAVRVETKMKLKERTPIAVNVHTAANVIGENVASNQQVQVDLLQPITKSNSINLNDSTSTIGRSYGEEIQKRFTFGGIR
jgi:diaminopimelate epimerase